MRKGVVPGCRLCGRPREAKPPGARVGLFRRAAQYCRDCLGSDRTRWCARCGAGGLEPGAEHPGCGGPSEGCPFCRACCAAVAERPGQCFGCGGAAPQPKKEALGRPPPFPQCLRCERRATVLLDQEGMLGPGPGGDANRCEICEAPLTIYDNPNRHRSAKCGRHDDTCFQCRVCCEARGAATPDAEARAASRALAGRILAAARAGDLAGAARLERRDVQICRADLVDHAAEWPALVAVRAAVAGGEEELAWALAAVSPAELVDDYYCHRVKCYSCVREIMLATLSAACALETVDGAAAGEAAAGAALARLDRFPGPPRKCRIAAYGREPCAMLGGWPVCRLAAPPPSSRKLVGVARALVANGAECQQNEILAMLERIELEPADEDFIAAVLDDPRLRAAAARLVGRRPAFTRGPIPDALARDRRWTPLRAAWLQAWARAARPAPAGAGAGAKTA